MKITHYLISDAVYYHRHVDPEKDFCYPQIVSRSINISRAKCGVQCTQNPLCVLYATDGGQCVLTEYWDGHRGHKEDFMMYTDWYTVK